jgi:hypothetical protein
LDDEKRQTPFCGFILEYVIPSKEVHVVSLGSGFIPPSLAALAGLTQVRGFS